MKEYNKHKKEILNLIIKNYSALCRLMVFNSKRAKEVLIDNDSISLYFNDIDVDKQINIAISLNEVYNLNLDTSILENPFIDVESWKEIINENNSEIVESFVNEVELWSTKITFPNSVEEIFVDESFEISFEGKLYHFFNNMVNDFELPRELKRKYIKEVLDKLTQTLQEYDNTILKSEKLPSHLLKTFELLKKVYLKTYQLIFKEFNYALKDFYDFQSKFLLETQTRQKTSKNFFSLNEHVEIHFYDLRQSLISKKLISKTTKQVALENAFKENSKTKINWIGGKDRLGCFVKLLKIQNKIKDNNIYKIALNIFLIDGKEISNLRNPKEQDSKKYINMLSSILQNHF